MNTDQLHEMSNRSEIDVTKHPKTICYSGGGGGSIILHVRAVVQVLNENDGRSETFYY